MSQSPRRATLVFIFVTVVLEWFQVVDATIPEVGPRVPSMKLATWYRKTKRMAIPGKDPSSGK